MVQTTNELIVGIELNEQYSQITYYHQSVREPMTLGGAGGEDQLPMALRLDADGIWHFWNGEPQQEEETTDSARIGRLYERLERQEVTEAGGISYNAVDLLAVYFRLCMDSLKLLTQNTKLQVMVTVKRLTDGFGELIAQALELCQVDRRYIYVQDYLSSFYYYAVNQKKELWSQDVALIDYEDGAIVGYVLHIDRSTKPAIARVDCVAKQPMDETVRMGREGQEWNREKDRLFFELLKKVFERRSVTVSYLMGDYFRKSWAERSIQYLCFKRHAFQGKNLYSKGACYAAMERAGLIGGRDILFCGKNMIERNLGMEMNIRGKESYYPLITAGVNWYEAYHVCEFILHGEREIRVISHPMTPGESTLHMMRLPGLPPRADRSTRLRMTVYFSSPVKCHIELEDLGLGGLVRASGLKWKRTITF